MKRFLLSIPIALLALRIALPAHAAETITDFHVDAVLSANRNLSISENINYDFGDLERHGIYRLIPERYTRDGANFDLHLSIGDAMQDGRFATQEVKRDGELRSIRLGDASTLLTADHAYTIDYATTRAINDFPAERERELYWNITGNDWLVPIEKAGMRIELPAPPTKTMCYTGAYGSTEQACDISLNGSVVTITARQPLQPGEGLTVAIRLPDTSMRNVTLAEKIWLFFQDNILLFTPILVLIGMFFVWRKYGRDPKGRGTIIAEYEEPDNLSPCLQAALIEQEVSSKAITATLLDLARRGYANMRFEGDPKKVETFYEKGKPIEDTLLPFERELLEGLFATSDSIDLSERHESFWKSLQKAKTEIYRELVARELFASNPTTIRFLWCALAVLIAVGCYLSAGAVGGWFVVSGLFSAAIIALFGWQMPRVTKAGAMMLERVQGFKKFLSVTEEARLAFSDAPSKRPEEFARFLPAAVAFGVEKEWAGQFANIQLPQPSYMSGNASTWSAISYVHAVDSFHRASISSIYTAPSSAGSGGSGFSGGGSGGGFGGGGGGSW